MIIWHSWACYKLQTESIKDEQVLPMQRIPTHPPEALHCVYKWWRRERIIGLTNTQDSKPLKRKSIILGCLPSTWYLSSIIFFLLFSTKSLQSSVNIAILVFHRAVKWNSERLNALHKGSYLQLLSEGSQSGCLLFLAWLSRLAFQGNEGLERYKKHTGRYR